jgi:hypothetical protein
VSAFGTGRGVSDVVSFVFIFALMVVAIATVTTVGFSSMQDFRDAEQADSAVTAFEVVGRGVDEVSAGDSPVRTGEIRLQGGTVYVDDAGGGDPSVEVTVQGPGTTYDVATGALVYELPGTNVTYESGAVFRGQGSPGAGGSVVENPPQFVCEGDTAVVSLVRLEPLDARSVGGGTVRVVARETNRTLLYPDERFGSAATGVTVEVNSDHGDAWSRTLERAGWSRTGPSTYECSAEQVFVRRVDIGIRLVS